MLYRSSINFSLLCLSLLALFVGSVSFVSAAQNADSVRAEIVWVDVNSSEHQLMLSQYMQDQWTKSVPIYTSTNALSSPALGTSINGDKLLIWSEQLKTRTILKFMTRFSDQNWTEANIFNDVGNENLAASIVYDANDKVWVFWSSARSGLSDIYVATAENWQWSKASMVNSANEVPDIHPVASINEFGEVVVEWTTYSYAEDRYIKEQAFFDVDVDNKMPTFSEDSVSAVTIPKPSFLPENALSILHFPSNVMIQSRPIFSQSQFNSK